MVQLPEEAGKYSKDISPKISRFIVDLCKEGERSAVVLSAARVDIALEDAIKALLRPNPGGTDDLFEGDRPLSTFSAKISLAYRLSLIGNNLERALQLIRRIRNDFAHSHEKLTLATGPPAARLLELNRLCEADFIEDVHKVLIEAKFQPHLVIFAQCIASVLISLEVTKIVTKRYKPVYEADL